MKSKTYIEYFVSVMLLSVLGLYPNSATSAAWQVQETPSDSVKADSIPPYESTKAPTYQPSYRFGDPFSNRMSKSPMMLADPSSIDLQVDFDSTVNYSVYERVGDVNFRPVTTMTFEEYDKYNDDQIAKEYFKERSAGLDGESAVSGRSLIPRLYISPVFDRLFGGSYVDIQPNGFVNLDFGGRWQRVDNPAIPLRQQRNGGFNFDQQISLNLVGKIGEKLAVTANFDNNNTFDFQNNLKVEFTGYEEDIVKKIEIGNVSMPVSNSLMTGAQALFGVKTQLQFGKLFITGVASRQQGKTEVLTIESGFQGKEFEVRASEYDENRHFFLGHFFRDNYENWLSTLPQLTSGVLVTRVEVYVINRNNDTESTREVVGLLDLGEGQVGNILRDQAAVDPGNYAVIPAGGQNVGSPTDNDANNLYADFVNNIPRASSEVSGALEEQFNFVDGTDFVKVGTARQLDQDEFVVNDKLGYISLLRQLQNDEMLAVSYQYTYNGNVYQVGELSQDYQIYDDSEVILMKLLRPNKINTDVPSWDLMMKNIYNLNASQIERDGFTLRVHYRDDATGIDNPSLHEGRRTKDQPLIELLGLDQLNQNNDRQSDGNFDYVEGVTIDVTNGSIMFPVLEPFGDKLATYFDDDEADLVEKYVYDTLYGTTKAEAELVASLNKFFIVGKFNAGSSSEISLPGINIAENSVIVTAGNTPLTEGLDYSVDYNLGRVRILNQGILSSGKTINISYEKADLFNFQARWLYGARADYRFSENFNIGATILHLNERAGGISRFSIGDEPAKNTKYGFDINYQGDMPFLTKAMDFLPLISTKAPSSITFNAEFAQMIPGTSNLVDGEGTSYIDDFEDAVTPQNISGWAGWELAATPETLDNRFGVTSASSTSLEANYKRAKMAWYSIDNSVFYQPTSAFYPENITEEDLANHYVRAVLPQEVFRERENDVLVVPENIFDIAYYPQERGQYNYNPDLDANGLLKDPKSNYGGITRAITTEVDFDKTNIEYIEFWMMDPFIETPRGIIQTDYYTGNNSTGGDLVFNLGSISEDVVPDGRHSFESGYPTDGDVSKTLENEWGRAPSEPFLTNNFENDASARVNQDLGLDGASLEGEETIFNDYLTNVRSVVSASALPQIEADPSGDDFEHYIGTDLDNRNAGILERYKNWNGLEGNSPINTGNDRPSASSNTPDNEDLNQDNTISDLEEYYEYKLSLKRGELRVGNNYIVDQITSLDGEANWYLFRIPIRDPEARTAVGGISDFKTIRYLRMYATNFDQPVVFRMAKFQLVGSQWRKYEEALNEPGLNEVPETSYSDFSISVVNIEENSTGGQGKSPYVLPPGIDRDRDNTTIVNRQTNEQSLQICVDDLDDKDGRAVYKNVSFDLINYGRIQMFLHAEAYSADETLETNDMKAFIRFGSDFTENYYEVEVPLEVTPENLTSTGETLAREVWPLQNEIDISIDELLGMKAERSRLDLDELIPYSAPSNDGNYVFTLNGSPDISSVQVIMIGVRNPESSDRSPKSICLWANELRVTDFDQTKGWAANARISAKLADVATISASTRYTSIGFGGIQQTIQQRTRDETIQYDISANVNVDKFLFPEKTGLRVPMFVSYEKARVTPQFDPLDPDVPLEASLATFDTPEERENYRKIVEERTERRSINFTNVGKTKVNPEANNHFYDIENLSFSYAYSDVLTSNSSTETFLQKSVSGGVAYNYSPKTISIEPFAKGEAFSSPFFKLIKDINLSVLPSNVSLRGDLNRSFRLTQLYENDLTVNRDDAYYERLFTFNRNYALRWNPFKSLSLNYTARVNAVIDEIEGNGSPIDGDIDTREEREYIWNEIKSLGRMRAFGQDISATYKLPLNKFPLTDWITADIKYANTYTWTAGSQVEEGEDFFGNTINNTRDQGLSGKLDMVKLYNKIGFLKEINSPPRKKKGEESSFNLAKGFLGLLMSLRNINMTYNIREGTTLSGYAPNAFLFGMDSSFRAPGWDFIMGSQDADIRFEAAKNGWLVENPNLSAPFLQTYSTDLNLRASLEPIKNLKIQLDASRTNNANFQELYRFDSLTNDFQSQTPSRSGSYTISYMAIRTSFDKKGNNHSSEVFDIFAANIGAVLRRQNAENTNDGSYDSLSQDVLIPAFLAAYSGKSSSEVSLSPFPKIPLPGWRLDYGGLSKIPALAAIFSSVSITHGYRSVYNVNDYGFDIANYQDQIGSEFDVSLSNNILDYPQATQATDSGRFAPVYIINQVTISEQFTPLIGINVKTKGNITARFEYKKDRTLSLSMTNAQITETTGNDVTLDFGYTKDKFKVPFKIKGRTVTLDNAITMRVSMTLRDAETVRRTLEGESDITTGSANFQMRPSLSYKINDQLDLTMYFERSVTEPKVSSFKTASTAFGAQLRFSLAQ